MKKLSFITILLALFIILWGAWVRISGSGDGCGEHWPLCKGALLPFLNHESENMYELLIEFFHRAQTGLFGIFVVILWGLSIKHFKPGSAPRVTALFVLLFSVLEAILGAELVLGGFVDQDHSLQRIFVVGLHLINTFFLLASLVCLYFSLHHPQLKSPKLSLTWYILFLTFIFQGISGSWAALASTLFPVLTFAEGIALDFNPSSHLVLRLRFLHPLNAFLVLSIGLLWLFKIKGKASYGSEACFFFLLMGNLALGALTFLSLSPTIMKLSHLLLSDLLWCSFIWTSLEHVLGIQIKSDANLVRSFQSS